MLQTNLLRNMTGWPTSVSLFSYDNINFTINEDSLPRGLRISPDGTKMIIAGGGNSPRLMHSYDLSIPGRISSATFTGSSSLSMFNPESLEVTPDGTKLYYRGSFNKIYYYSMSTAWNVTTLALINTSASLDTQDAAMRAIKLNSDGTVMYALGSINDRIYQYDLITAYNTATFNYANKSLSIAGQETTPHEIKFSKDFTKIYVIGEINDSIFQYDMTIAEDISTGSYNGSVLNVSSQSTVPRAIEFSDTGGLLYVLSTTPGDVIYQYSI